MMIRSQSTRSSTKRWLPALVCTSLLSISPMGGGLAAQTPVPRPVANPAIRVKAQNRITAIRTNAGRYDQALAAIARLATAPVTTDAQLAAVTSALKTNLKVLRDTLNDRLMQIALTDATFKQSVEAANRDPGGKAIATDPARLDRLGGATTVRAAMSRRLQDDSQTLKRVGDALLAKSKARSAAAPLIATLGSVGRVVVTAVAGLFPTLSAQTPGSFETEQRRRQQGALLAIVFILVGQLIEDAVNTPDDAPPPPPSPQEVCFDDLERGFAICLNQAGNDFFKRVECHAKWTLGFALCLSK
jgi:hypothetical protein